MVKDGTNGQHKNDILMMLEGKHFTNFKDKNDDSYEGNSKRRKSKREKHNRIRSEPIVC